MDFFGIGFLELLFILVVALLVLGPNKMVDVARTLGKQIRELRRATLEVSRALSPDEEPRQPPPPQRQPPPEQPTSEEHSPNPKA